MSIAFYRAAVRNVEQVTPRTIRITFGGEELRDYIASDQPDDRLMLFVPPPGEPLVLPRFEGRWVYEEGAPRPTGRHYTIRRRRDGEIDIDFYLHAGGIASGWAASARPGDIVALTQAGSELSFPPQADWMLIVADASAVPAAGRLIEESPAGLRIQAFLAVDDPREEQTFRSAADVAITWLHVGGNRTPEAAVEAAVRAFPWPGGKPYAWVAGETGLTQALRRFLRDERQLDRTSFCITGYWKRKLNEDQWADRRQEVIGDLGERLGAAKSAGKSEAEFYQDLESALEEAGLA